MLVTSITPQSLHELWGYQTINADLNGLRSFLPVAKAGGFGDAARTANVSASTLSEAVRRLETQLGVRLLHRTTGSVTPTKAEATLIGRLAPALGKVEAALYFVNETAGDAPVSATRLVAPAILPGFLAAHPDINV